MQINLGCGRYLLADHDNVDSQPYPSVTVVRRVPPLPYEDASVESIYAGHVLEHIPPADLMPLLHDCLRVLQPGGTLTVVVPDADRARDLMQHHGLNPLAYALAVQGETFEDMPHWIVFNEARLRQVVALAGFEINTSYDWKSDWRVADRRVPWQAGAQGVKPS